MEMEFLKAWKKKYLTHSQQEYQKETEEEDLGLDFQSVEQS